MKKITILITAFLLLTSCSGTTVPDTALQPSNAPRSGGLLPQPDPVDVTDGYEDLFTYPTTGNVFTNVWAINENGIVYMLDYVIDDEAEFEWAVKFQIKAYNMHGELLSAYELPNGFDRMCVGNGALYYTRPVWVPPAGGDDGNWEISHHELYSYDLQTQEEKALFNLKNVSAELDSVKNLVYFDEKIYILAIMEDYITQEYDIFDQYMMIEGKEISTYHYQYDGRVLAAYDVENETLEIVFDGVIENFAVTPHGNIMICARNPHANDGWGKNYFQIMDPDTMTLGDPIYRDITRIRAFATDGYGVMYDADIGALTSPPGSLKYLPLGEDTGIVVMAEAGGRGIGLHHSANAIAYHNGFTFYLYYTGTITEIRRIRNSIVVALPIKIIGTAAFGEIPREGHNIAFSTLPYDEFALSVLTGGSSCDIAYIGAWQDFACNVRDRGAFYPLNDVPGVQEFLSACHPFIREAATDKNGDIWMLPIEINVNAIIYSGENCRTAELDFASAATVEDIITLVRKGAEYDTSGRNYVFDQISLLRKSLMQSIRSNGSLDTAAFRRLALVLKGFINERERWGTAMPHLNNPDFLFDNLSVQTSAQLMGRDDLYVVPVTGTGTQSSADCYFLTVNPGSGKLKETLEYISAVCNYLLTKENNFMLKQEPTVSEYARRLHAAYVGSVIDFAVSEEIFADDFDRYLRGEIDLDTMIREADRKLAMYRGE
jgi:hypothetical protein